MGRSLPTWRRLGAALAALALVLLAFGPSLDRILCHDEPGLSAAAAEAPPAKAQPGPAPPGHAEEGLGACAHGHCHHASPFVPARAAQADAQDRPGAAHALARQRVPTSDPKFGLMRPPRG